MKGLKSDKSLCVYWRIFWGIFVTEISNQNEFVGVTAVTKFYLDNKDFPKNAPMLTK